LGNINKEIKVLTAQSGAQAIEIFQKDRLKTCCVTRIPLVLMKIAMPVIDGLEATSRILAICQVTGSETTVVGVAAFVPDDMSDRCDEAGMAEVVEWPNESKIEEVITKYFRDPND